MDQDTEDGLALSEFEGKRAEKLLTAYHETWQLFWADRNSRWRPHMGVKTDSVDGESRDKD